MDAITKSVEILTSPKSDHLAVHMCLSFDTAIRGDGYWKFNNEWLDNDNFSDSLLKMVDECTNEFGEILSSADFWSLCKNKIRTFCIEFAKNRNRYKKSKMSHIEKQLHEAYVNITKKS